MLIVIKHDNAKTVAITLLKATPYVKKIRKLVIPVNETQCNYNFIAINICLHF